MTTLRDDSAGTRVVRTTRLTLEPLRVEHAEEMFRVLSDPAIYEYENEPPATLEWLRQRFARLETRRSPDGKEQWLNWVVRHSSSELIGYVQATVHPDGRAAIAYEFSSKHWGQGFAQEAVRAMLAELVEHHQVKGFSAVLKSKNHRSLRLLEHLGFSLASQIEPDELMMRR